MFACIHSRAAQLSLPGLPDASQALLVECAYSFSPRIEETAPDAVIADLQGCNQLFGNDNEIAERIVRRASELGLDVSVAVAANPDAAECAARGRAGITVIPSGREAQTLAGLPLTAIEHCGLRFIASEQADAPVRLEEMLQTLDSWGIRTLGELAALPVAGLSERLGSAGVGLREMARGASNRALVVSVPAPGFEKSEELDYPVGLLEPLLFIVASLLNQLCRNLEERALATNEITIRLELEPGGEHERVLRLPVPMLNNQTFLRLLQLDLEQHPPERPVVAVWVRTRPAKPRTLQDGLFVPLAPEPQKLELTLARIVKLVGAENAGAAELLDTHRPGAFRIRRFEVQRPGAEMRGRAAKGVQKRTTAQPPNQFLAFRHFRPALAAQVETLRERPARVAARGIRGKVVSVAGPWRSAGDWWSPEPWDRDEWDVALAGGDVYRIYFDRRRAGWFVEGSYD